MKYRKDIEGLRAVAVIPVVIFHVAQSYIPGGFVGVDIFFVISGYLISSHILKEREQGIFSILTFYERRMRRIAPAYLFLLAVVSAVVVATAFPSEVKAYGLSLAAAITSLTNVYFWATTNYFAVPAEELPLLHTWSLATEEQFYLLFPLLIVWMRPWSSKAQQIVVVAILLASLGYSAVTAVVAPTSSFYLIFSRAWELLLGTLLAMRRRRSYQESAVLMEVAAAIGSLLIVAAMVCYSPETKFPGVAALLPCLGAALVIHAAETRSTYVTRFLALPPLRAIGAISYSLYLWHWPVLVFQRTTGFLAFGDSKLAARGAVVAVSLVLATLSWAVVERTTRNRAKVATAPLFLAVCLSAAALLVVAFTLDISGGLPGRFSPEVRSLAAYLDYDQTEQFRVSKCFLRREDSFATYDKDTCLPKAEGRPTYLIAGDSHAAALSFGLRKVMDNDDFLQVSGVGCPPIVVPQKSPSPACGQLLDLAFSQLPRDRKIDGVILVARWNLGRMGLAPGWNLNWLRELGDTMNELRAKGLRVILVGPMPEYQRELPRLLGQALLYSDPGGPQRSLAREPFELDRLMHDFAVENGFRYISLVDVLCPRGVCVQTVDKDVPLLFDTDHLTAAGSVFVTSAIKSQIEAPFR